MVYKCPKAGCDFESPTHQGLAGHIAGHKKRGELPKGKVHAYPEVKEAVPTSYEIADDLLSRVVDAITASDLKDAQVKEAKKLMVNLEQEVRNLKAENARILKIHNEQVKRKELTSSDELIRLARQPRLREK